MFGDHLRVWLYGNPLTLNLNRHVKFFIHFGRYSHEIGDLTYIESVSSSFYQNHWVFLYFTTFDQILKIRRHSRKIKRRIKRKYWKIVVILQHENELPYLLKFNDQTSN